MLLVKNPDKILRIFCVIYFLTIRNLCGFTKRIFNIFITPIKTGAIEIIYKVLKSEAFL